MRLFTIGDSISQGFMSVAAARTDLSFSTLIAEILGLGTGERPGSDFRFPGWPKGGHPVDLEALMRKLSRRYGSDIWGPIEWPMALFTIGSFLDDIEDYYERGEGDEDTPYPTGAEWFHNVASRGFDVADTWLVSPRLCREQIAFDNQHGGGEDNTFATPNASFYRTALTVLNPSRQQKYDDHTALRWLEAHATDATGEGGVENLILWLGANNALGTVVDLDIISTENDTGTSPIDLRQPERVKFNLWTPEHFEEEYRELFKKVHETMAANVEESCNVFVGTVPPVTIAPLAKGVGEAIPLEDPFGVVGDNAYYYKYYTYFIFEEDFAHTSDVRLTREEAYRIDRTVARYNETIAKVVEEKNDALGVRRYHIVDIAQQLIRLAYKRNNGQPTYELPEYLENLSPKPNTKYYHADRKRRLVQGGIVSLDGVHPSAIGQALIAREFLKVMKAAGVAGAEPEEIPWEVVCRRDKLWKKPLDNMAELYEHETLAEIIVRLIRRCSKDETDSPTRRIRRGGRDPDMTP